MTILNSTDGVFIDQILSNFENPRIWETNIRFEFSPDDSKVWFFTGEIVDAQTDGYLGYFDLETNDFDYF